MPVSPRSTSISSLWRPRRRIAPARHADLAQLSATARAAGASFGIVGRAEGLPPPWREVVAQGGADSTSPRRLSFFLNYSGRTEIADAAERCLRDHPDGEVGEEAFAAYLATAGRPDPDLVIYAGGELEPKDFLLWQASYAEIWYAPGDCRLFSGDDLRQALDGYFHRHRRWQRRW